LPWVFTAAFGYSPALSPTPAEHFTDAEGNRDSRAAWAPELRHRRVRTRLVARARVSHSGAWANLLPHRRLRQIKSIRGGAELQLLIDRNEASKLADLEVIQLMNQSSHYLA